MTVEELKRFAAWVYAIERAFGLPPPTTYVNPPLTDRSGQP
jgi:hypothetical protein